MCLIIIIIIIIIINPLRSKALFSNSDFHRHFGLLLRVEDTHDVKQ